MKLCIAAVLSSCVVRENDLEISLKKGETLVMRQGSLFEKFTTGNLKNLFEGVIDEPADKIKEGKGFEARLNGKSFIVASKDDDDVINAALASVSKESATALAGKASALAGEINDLKKRLTETIAENQGLLKKNQELDSQNNELSIALNEANNTIKDLKAENARLKKG